MMDDSSPRRSSAPSPSIRYRVRQFMAALTARVSLDEYALVERVLTPAEVRLFWAMPRYDQRHCLDVYWTLVHAGYTDCYLLRTAMIHDCGKTDDDGHPMALGWYVVSTVIKRIPALYIACARRPWGPMRAIAIYAAHAWRGATMLEAAGSPPEMVMMIRHYHDPQPHGLAAVLQWADEQH